MSLSKRLSAVVSVVAKEIGADELGLAAALLLIAVGLCALWRPAAACLACGGVLLWVYLPQRTSFVQRLPMMKKERP